MRSARTNRFAVYFVLSIAIALLAGACSGRDPDNSTPTSAPGPSGSVADSSPYWCKLVPQAALWRITGVRPDKLSQDGKIPREGGGGCFARTADGDSILWLELISGDFARSDAALNSGYRLPNSLGYAVFIPSGNAITGVRSSALFWCGKELNFIDVQVTPVPTGRDSSADFTALLDIAERRLATLRGCQLKRSGPVPTPAS